MSTLSKPTLNKSAAAMAFAENKMSSAENVEKRKRGGGIGGRAKHQQ